MGVSRDCGHFRASVNISGGLHDNGGIVKLDKGLRDSAMKKLIELKNKHEEALLEEWCESFGWPRKVADAVAETARLDREELLEADRKGREMRRKQREDAGV